MDKIELALCIKNGYMKHGRQFCVKGSYYEYIHLPDDQYNTTMKYAVKSLKNTNCSHSMSNRFFHEYFVEQQLPDELFEI